MKAIFLLLIGISIGLFAGYQYAESRYSEVKKKLGDLTESEMETYLQLKSEKEKYAKADEILGKAFLIFMADLGIRLSESTENFAKSAAQGTKIANSQNSETAKVPIQTPKPPPIESPLPEKPVTIVVENVNSKKPVLANSQSSRPTPAGTDRRSETFTVGIAGRASYSGARPTPQVIKMSADPACAKANAGKLISSEDIVLNPNGTLANVFVYIKEGLNPSLVPARPNTPVILNQEGCVYLPHVLGIQVGQPLQIINSDAVLHNIHSMAKINAPFNMGMAIKGQTTEKKFTNPEVMVKIKCDVHGWMNAYVGVLDHPYFAVTDSNGAYAIKMPPPGNYLLEAWHEKLGTKSQYITVTDGQANLSAQFQF